MDSRSEQQAEEKAQALKLEKARQEKVALEAAEKAEQEKKEKEARLKAEKEKESDVKLLSAPRSDTDIKLEPIPPVNEESAKTIQGASPTESEKEIVGDETSKVEQVEPKAAPEKAEMVSKEVAEPAMTKTMAKKAIPKAKGGNHYVITVGEKDASHPFYGKGHHLGFSVNDVGGDDIVVERGKTYLIEVVTDPLHDVYLSEKDIGWGSMAWNAGVEGQFIYNGIITFKPDKNTPSELFYSCRNHPYMGGKIHVIEPGEKVNLTKRQASAPGNTMAKAAKPAKKATKGMVSQKLMFAKMLMTSSAAKKIKAGNNKNAADMFVAAEKRVASAKQELDAGNLDEALALVTSAVNDLKKAKKLAPSEGQLSHYKERYEEIQHSLADFEKSHEKSYKTTLKKKGKEAAVDYDKAKVKRLKAEADAAAKQNDYAKANKLLEQAQRAITVALKQMLDSTTIVYDLNFETPQEEYEYELRRFKGYEILIPIAIKAKKPTEGAKGLMNTYLEKGRKMREAAIAKASEGNYPVAIAMLLDATKQVRRALRMVGVTQ